MPPQRVVFNLPHPGISDRIALVDCVPRIGDTIVMRDTAYEVVKVAHVVHTFSGIVRARTPVIYLASERSLSSSEKHYAEETSL